MTKRERTKIIKAIGYFLNDDPDKWVCGIDELFLLVYEQKWSEHLKACKSINVWDLLKQVKNYK